MLVARDEVEHPWPIIGYNVIEEMIRNRGQGRSKGAIVDIMSFALVDVNVESVSEMVEFVQGQVEENLCLRGVVYKQSNSTSGTDDGGTMLCQLWPTREKNTGAI